MSSRSYSSRHDYDRDRRDTRRDDRDRDRHYRERDRDHDRDRERDRRDRDRRDRERDEHRRDRRDEDSYRPSRRDRTPSPPRRRSRSPRDARDDRKDRSRTNGKDAAPSVNPEEQKKKEKLAKLEAWKKKQADKAAKEAAANPASPVTSGHGSPAPTALSVASPKTPIREAAPVKTLANGAIKVEPKKASPKTQGPSTTAQHKLTKPISGFGLQKAAVIGAQKKRANALGGDETEERKIQLLPDMTDVAVAADDAEEEVEDEEMTDAPASTTNEATVEEEDDEIDPLDAFMSNLGKTSAPSNSTTAGLKGQVLGDEDEDDRSAVNNAMEDLMNVQQNKKKKKELPTITWSEEKLTPFRKDFYTETQEVKDMTEEEVASILARENVKIRGIEPPNPVAKWSSLALSAPIMDTIRKLGFEAPTSIQGTALPVLLSGRDGICIAQTGSGKTLAYMMAVFKHCLHQEPLSKLENGPLALIVAPTRELAFQVKTASQPFAKALDLRVSVAYGGQSIADQIADLKRGTHILVGTPGRLIEMLTIRKLDLKRCTFLVVDEADRLLDMGFQPSLERISSLLRPDHQSALFSATFPEKMQQLARKYLSHSPVEIIVGGRSTIPPNITLHVEVLKPEERFMKMLTLLGDLFYEDDDARALIFVERKESADELLAALMKKGYPCDAIHGTKDQQDRASAYQDFKSGALPILIATSVAARGLDVAQLKLVINWDAPNHGEDMVHRVGRTGRAGRDGTAWVFLTPDQDRFAPDIVKVMKASKRDVPEEVQKLSDDFLEKVKSGKEKVASSGFGGRGLERLDELREAKRAADRKTYKTGDEPDEEEKDEDKKAADKIKTEDIFAKATGQAKTASVAPVIINGVPQDNRHNENRFHFVVQKREIPPPDENAAKPGQPGGPKKNAMSAAQIAAEKINARLSAPKAVRPGQPIDNKGPDAGAYHATLEINDFSQKARWAATNRSNIVKLLEAGDVSITNKGTYVKPGAETPAGEQKLYILVEGETDTVRSHLNHFILTRTVY